MPITPRISVITCTYNSEAFIRDNLDSVWGTNPPFEQVIVDAKSTDETLTIVEEYRRLGHNIRVFERLPAGISDAMNFGMESASGDVIQVLHSDDYLIDPHAYSKAAERFEETDCLWLYARNIAVDHQRNKVGEVPPKWIRKFRGSLLALMNYVPHPAVFLRKELLTEFGKFDDTLKIIMDWDYWLRISARYRPEVIDEYWCAFRLHEGSLSTSEVFSKKLHAEEKTVLYRHFGRLRGSLFYAIHHLMYVARYVKNARLYTNSAG